MNEWHALLPTPLGTMRMTTDGRAITALEFDVADGASSELPAPVRALAEELRGWLDSYFRGENRPLEVPLAPQGSPFQREVWNALLTIPYGETVSYAEIARRVGRPAAVRAVGAANGRNPIAVVIPCHRVIGADGSLTGYGGGLARKRALLALEAPSLASQFAA